MNGLMSLDTWTQWAGTGLSAAIYAGFTATLLTLVVLPADLLLRRVMTSGQRGLLWVLVLLRLAIPIGPGSPYSLERAFDLLAAASTEAPANSSDAAPAQNLPAPFPSVAPAPAPSHEIAADSVLAVAETTVGESRMQALMEVLLALWVLAIPISLAMTFGRHTRFVRRLARTRPTDDPRLRRLWDECRLRAEVGRSIPIVVTDLVPQPALHGLFRPRLLLPADVLENRFDDDQLQMVMLHELAHVRRRDVLVNWGLALLCAFQWWNPVFWFATRRFAALREEACDAFALRCLAGNSATTDHAVRYGELLLTLASWKTTPRWTLSLPASLLGFTFWSRLRSRWQQRSLESRLKALRSGGRGAGVRQRVLFGAGLVTIAAAGLTNAQTSRPEEAPFDWTPVVESLAETWEGPAGPPRAKLSETPKPREQRDYDVGTIVSQWGPHCGGEAAAGTRLRDQAEGLLGVRRSMDGPAGPLVRPASGLNPSNPGLTSLGYLCALNGKRLTVVTTAATHEQVAALLAVLKSSRPNQVQIECRILSCPINLADWGAVRWTLARTDQSAEEGRETMFGGESFRMALAIPDGSPNDGLKKVSPGGSQVAAKTSITEDLPVAIGEISDDQAALLIRGIQSSRDSNLQFCPKLTLHPAMVGSLFSGVERVFVVGQSRPASGRSEPQLSSVPEGIGATLRAIALADSERVRLQCRLRMTRVLSVRTFTSSSPAYRDGKSQVDPGLKIEIPAVRTFSIDVDREIPEGRSLLIGCPPALEGDAPVYVMLTPRVLPME